MAEGLLSFLQIEAAIIPIDLAAGANNGDWVSLKNYKRCAVLLIADVGTAGEDPIFKLQQAKTAAGGSSKDLNFTVIHEKEGATVLTGVATWTRKTQTAATSYTSATGGENEQMILVEVDGAELDVANGFKFIQLSVADTGATVGKIGCGLYLLYEPRYPQATLADAKA